MGVRVSLTQSTHNGVDFACLYRELMCALAIPWYQRTDGFYLSAAYIWNYSTIMRSNECLSELAGRLVIEILIASVKTQHLDNEMYQTDVI